MTLAARALPALGQTAGAARRHAEPSSAPRLITISEQICTGLTVGASAAPVDCAGDGIKKEQ
jgi:hypothetical protein